jgi:hypothetical protein
MANIIPSYTQCSLTVHINKEFQLFLTKPSEEAMRQLKSEFSLNRLDIDKDDDVACEGGRWNDIPAAVIKGIAGYLSKQTIQVVLQRGTTDDCFRVFYRFLEVLYRTPREAVAAGIYYIQHDTITKVKFRAPIYNLFGPAMQKQIAQWTDLTTGALVNPISDGRWQERARGLIDIGVERYEKMYKGQPSAIVIPAAVSFTLWVPSKFSRMTSYKVSIATESVEDFHEDLYFVQSEFPYGAHVQLVEKIETM